MTPEAKILLGAVRDLAPSISARSAEIDTARRLPPDLLAQLTAAGCFRMFVPKSHGGLDIDVPASMEIIEMLATADGSTGWVVMIGSETPMLLALLSRKHFDSLYANTPDLIIAGAFAPRGQAELIDGNYRVSGRWGFASGCQHSQFLFGNCIVTENGTPRAGVIPGTAQARAMMFAPSKAQILDTWSVNGLRGTGSHDIAVENLTVPADDSFDIFFGQSSIETPAMAEPLLYAALHIGTVAIGIAQRALTEIVALANTNKRRLYASASLAESSALSVPGRTRGRESARRSQLPAHSGRRRMEFGSRGESSLNRRTRAGDGRDQLGCTHVRRSRRYVLQSRRRHIALRQLLRSNDACATSKR